MDLNEAVQVAEGIRANVDAALADLISDGTVLMTAAGATGNAHPIDAHPVIAVHIDANGLDFLRAVPEVAKKLAGVIPQGTSVTYIPRTEA